MMAPQSSLREQTTDILKLHKGERGNLIPILQELQARFRYLPRESMQETASYLGMPESEVYSVATFYNQFRLTPAGRHMVKVCLGTACHIKGGRTILEAWQRRLNIAAGQVTGDKEFGLERVACVGCCAMAPVAVVDEEVQGKVTPTKVDGILASFQRQDKP